MEKQAGKSKGNKILKYLRKTASFSISTAPIRPENNINNHKHRFSGPLVHVVPAEARRRTKSGRSGGGSGLEVAPPEPTSPKVSCMGQIKLKKVRSRRRSTSPGAAVPRPPRASLKNHKLGKPTSVAIKVEKSAAAPAAEEVEEESRKAPAPGLGKLRKFSSGREALSGFDWTKVETSDDEEEVLVPHSAPMIVGGGGGGAAGEKRKEISLWKRRTAAPPVPLQLS